MRFANGIFKVLVRICQEDVSRIEIDVEHFVSVRIKVSHSMYSLFVFSKILFETCPFMDGSVSDVNTLSMTQVENKEIDRSG